MRVCMQCPSCCKPWLRAGKRKESTVCCDRKGVALIDSRTLLPEIRAVAGRCVTGRSHTPKRWLRPCRAARHQCGCSVRTRQGHDSSALIFRVQEVGLQVVWEGGVASSGSLGLSEVERTGFSLGTKHSVFTVGCRWHHPRALQSCIHNLSGTQNTSHTFSLHHSALRSCALSSSVVIDHCMVDAT